MLSFPKDHLPHCDARSEWWYLWGKTDDDDFFTTALFKTKAGGDVFNVIHGSVIHGDTIHYFDEIDDELEGMVRTMGYENDRFKFNSPEISFTANIASNPIEHSVENRKYYSIPDLRVLCKIAGEKQKAHGWFDHEWAEMIWTHLFKRKGDKLIVGNWEWYAIKLHDTTIMLYHISGDDFCSFTMHGETQHPAFTIEYNGESTLLTIVEYGISYQLYYLCDEQIFRPKIGMKYSETPFFVTCNGMIIGHGMREKTYGGIKIDESKIINSELIRSEQWVA
jgi:hypothetical protein